MSVRGRATILACALAFASTVIGCLLAPSQALATTPLAPTGLLAAPGPADPLVATLVWTPPLDPTVTGYRVRIATHAAGPWTLLGTTSAATYVFDTGFGSIPYRYRVSAVDADGHESVPAEDTPPPPAWFTPVHEGMASAVTLCRKCHRAHSAESGRILRADVAPLCWECHDGQLAGAADIRGGADSFAAASGHVLGAASGPRLLTATCTGCHGAHQPIAADPMLPAAEVNGVAVAGAGPAWCLACHDAAGSWAGGGYPSTAAPSRDASGYPVSGAWPGPAAWAGSADGHAGIPEATQTADGGRQVRRPVGDCLYCHAAHRGPNRYDALLATFTPPATSTLASDQADGAYASLCFTCHGGAPASGFTTAPADIRSFATTTALDSTAGHRVITSGGVLPQGAPLPCYECHNPHGSARGNGRLISDALGAGLMTTSTPTAVRRFCFTCHTTSDTAEGWDSETSAYYAVEASETVVGLRRDGGAAAPYNALRLPSLSGHNVGDAGTCYSCHGNDYSPGGSNVHRPGAGGYDPIVHTSTETCFAICHNGPELGPAHSSDTTAPVVHVDCGGCHPTAVDAIRPWDKTCAACHPSYPASHPSAFVPQPTPDHLGTDAAMRAVRTSGSGCSDTPANGNLGCHSLNDLGGLHYELPDRGCAICHGEGKTPTKECLACHNYYGNGLIGPTNTARVYPTADDSATAAVTVFPAAPANRWSKVGATDITDGTYIALTSNGQVTFSSSTIPSIPSATATTTVRINNVTVVYYRKYSGAGTLPANSAPLLKVGGGYYQWATTVNAGINYAASTIGWTTNPKTGLPWTLADVTDPSSANGLQGFGVYTTDASPSVRVTQIYLMVNYTILKQPFSGFPVFSAVYHHNNVGYALDPADGVPGTDYFVSQANPYPDAPIPNGLSAKYWLDCYARCHRGYYGTTPSWTPYAGSLMWYSLCGNEQQYPGTATWIPEERTLVLDAGTLPDAAQLSFKTRWQFSGGGVVTGYVEVSTDQGGSWTPLTGTVHGVSRATLTGNSPAAWGDAVYDLSAYAGQDTRIRFRYSMPTYNYGIGWGIDDVTITGSSGLFYFDGAETARPEWTSWQWFREPEAWPY